MSNSKSRICNYWENRPNIKWILSLLEGRKQIPEDQIGTSLPQRDQMHAGTDSATRKFYEWSNLPAGSRILELGAGLGGTGRYLAGEMDATVCAVELSEHLNNMGRQLTENLNLGDRVSHVKADITRFQHPKNRFDAVWIQHVDMQIEDKAGLYDSSRRNLESTGKVLWHDWLGGTLEPTWPLFWSVDGSLSWLCTKQVFQENLAGAGLELIRYETIEELTLKWFETALGALLKHAPQSPLVSEMKNAIGGIESGAIVPFFAEAIPIPEPDRL